LPLRHSSVFRLRLICYRDGRNGLLAKMYRHAAHCEEPMLKHNTFFDGQVQSLGYERNGRKQTVGVIVPGEFTFNTDGPERMTVVNGELQAKVGNDAWVVYAAGTAFEVAAKSSFRVKAMAPAAYWCEFL
jgi:hypothetical protein